ncbi:MAG: Verru_Chthon cassette protein A [Chthoniobacteraceae bacterium]
MNTQPSRILAHTRGPRPRGNQAIALVTVLAVLVIISAMVIAFMSSVGTEVSASKAHADSNSAQILVDTTANIVMAQIRQATTETVGSTETSWASQPGMIRTFIPNGGLSKAYKLYSSATMVDTKVDLAGETTAMANWASQPAIFTDLNQPVSGNYPITPPPDNTIDGYSLSATPPGVSSSGSMPMPARWLYILSDGSVVSPTVSGTGTRATVLGSATTSIVGRIAFWTDDESSKVNINTASEGSYWDTPHFAVNDDVNLANYQPVNGEYQRYPGHPAGVSLSAVFPKPSGFTDLQWADSIYGIVPRIQPGGSEQGSVSSTTAIIPDTDRLYSNTDELLFRSGTDGRVTQGFTQAQLVQSRFLLTARSVAPELNLFGRPRVSIWPVDVDLATNPSSPYTNAFDRLSAFCSTYGGTSTPKRYYFQRQDSGSATNDYANISRNRDLYSYLQSMTSRAVPGFSGFSFQDKYGSDADQILTGIFDYIRCTNLFDDNLGNSYVSGSAPTQFYQFTTPRKSTSYYWPGHGQVSPIQIGTTQGLGRYYTLSEIGLHLICTADEQWPRRRHQPLGLRCQNRQQPCHGPSVDRLQRRPDFRRHLPQCHRHQRCGCDPHPRPDPHRGERSQRQGQQLVGLRH